MRRRKELTNIKAEINKIETRKTKEKFNKAKSSCFDIYKIGKPLARLRKREYSNK